MEDFIGNTRLIPARRLMELSKKANGPGWVQTLSHLSAIGLSGTLLSMSWGTIWAIQLFVAHGILLNFLYAGVHELSHRTVFRTKVLNDLFGHLFAFIVITPRRADQCEHFRHHKYTQDIEKDGELDGGPPFSLKSYVLYFSGLTYWGYNLWNLSRHAAGRTVERYLTDNERRQVVREARIYLAGYAIIAVVSIFANSWAAVMYWIGPMFLTKFIHQCQNITEHTAMPHVDDILLNTRTIKTNPFLNWLAWNMPYHTAHHTYPSVPFFRLPLLHREMVAAMGHEPETIGYLTFQIHMFRKLIKDSQSRYTGSPISSY